MYLICRCASYFEYIFFSQGEKSGMGNSWVLLILFCLLLKKLEGILQYVMLLMEESLEILSSVLASYHGWKLKLREVPLHFQVTLGHRLSIIILSVGILASLAQFVVRAGTIWYRLWCFYINNYLWLLCDQRTWHARALRLIIMSN